MYSIVMSYEESMVASTILLLGVPDHYPYLIRVERMGGKLWSVCCIWLGVFYDVF